MVLQPSWQSSLGFSERLSNVSKMQVFYDLYVLKNQTLIISSISAYKTGFHDLAASEIQANARSIESNMFKDAKSKVSRHVFITIL